MRTVEAEQCFRIEYLAPYLHLPSSRSSGVAINFAMSCVPSRLICSQNRPALIVYPEPFNSGALGTSGLSCTVRSNPRRLGRLLENQQIIHWSRISMSGSSMFIAPDRYQRLPESRSRQSAQHRRFCSERRCRPSRQRVIQSLLWLPGGSYFTSVNHMGADTSFGGCLASGGS